MPLTTQETANRTAPGFMQALACNLPGTVQNGWNVLNGKTREDAIAAMAEWLERHQDGVT